MALETIATVAASGLMGFGSCEDGAPRPSHKRGKFASKKEISMFVNVNAHPGSRPSAVGQLGELSRARVILSEFKYNKGTEIFGETEPADYIYQVVDGAVRIHKLLSDGRRQIGACHLIGDIFGLENGAFHRFTAEAIVDTTVRLMKRSSLEHVAESDALVAIDLL